MMPKPQRSPKEIEAVREDILGHALDLIVLEGFNSFSMRKLAARLGIAAKTIYNYYRNQDELYLCILTKGYEQLYTAFERAVRTSPSPSAQLEAAIRAYVTFGLDNPHIYNLMFTWHVPKYNDYVGTPMEKAAYRELTAALKCSDLFMGLIDAFLEKKPGATEDVLRFEMIQIWSQMHGYVSGINNTLLDYMHETPLALQERIIERLVANTEQALQEIGRKNA